MQCSDLTLGCCTVKSPFALQPPLPIRMGFLPCKDTVGFYGSEVLGSTLVKGCSALELWWHGTLEMFD